MVGRGRWRLGTRLFRVACSLLPTPAVHVASPPGQPFPPPGTPPRPSLQPSCTLCQPPAHLLKHLRGLLALVALVAGAHDAGVAAAQQLAANLRDLVVDRLAAAAPLARHDTVAHDGAQPRLLGHLELEVEVTSVGGKGTVRQAGNYQRG